MPDAASLQQVLDPIFPGLMGVKLVGTKFIAGAKVGTTVRGESIALHRGRTTQLWQTSIYDEAGKLCAVVSQTQLVMDKR